jgi:asparagine synthase (glutamine-hydrolysing)
MTEVMVHRGPDDVGLHRSPGVALGMRRLSVIDLAGSKQPSTNEDGSLQLVFNGEIFNFRALRRELKSRGHELRTDGDTETIVHLYEDHGADLVRRLRGMFAIALWDMREQKLLLARDRLGVKPLYYATTTEGLAFASEIKCLLAGGLLTPRVDLEAAQLFLSLGYVPAPLTLFQGVYKLPPATVLEWQAGQIRGPTVYWTPLDTPALESATWEEDAEHLLELLRDAVGMRMISDVPLGVMLSGGLDSSLVAAVMAETSTAPIETFSIGFVEDASANELAWARKTARRLGANHHELLTSATEHEGLLDDALWHLEEPISDLSFIGFLLLSRLAREHVTVALCGQAADELLAGYRKHLASRVADLPYVPAALAGDALRALTRSRAGSSLNRMSYALSERDDVKRVFGMSAILPPSKHASAMGPALRNGDPLALLQQTHAAGNLPDPTRSQLLRTLFLDIQLALPDLMFLYFDKMSMAASLEVRVPFADHELVNFCMALPDDRRIRGRQGKHILRHISRDLVDESIITRPKRGFFRSGASAWLAARETLVRETLLDERCRRRGLLNAGAVSEWLDRSTGRGRAGEPLLAAFMLERWHRVFVDSDGEASSALNRPAPRATPQIR